MTRAGSRLGVALIGAGRIGRAHGERLASLPGCDLALVVDGDAERARSVAEATGARSSARAEEAFEDDSIDALVIATPVASHVDLAIAAATAGKPFFLEKPLAHDLISGRQIVEAVERTGVAALVGFQRRFDPPHVEAKRRIDAGELGKLEGYRAVGRDPHPPPLEYLLTSGDLLVDMGIHDLDSARFLVGEVAEVQAIGGSLAIPELAEHGLFDTAVATLKFENGAVGTLEVALRTAYGYEIRAEVLGELGRLHIEVDRKPDLLIYDERGGSFDRPRGFEERFGDAYRLELAYFLSCVRSGEAMMPDPLDAWKSLRLAFAAQHALVTGETVQVANYGASESPP